MFKCFISAYNTLLLPQTTFIILKYPAISKYRYVNAINITSRDVLVGNVNGQINKFAEKIVWGQGNNLAICIGYNPAQLNTSNLDKSNELIVKLLQQNGYDGYYLFNIYSIISPIRIKTNNNLLECIKNTINNQNKKYDLYIFIGSSVYLKTIDCNNLKSIRVKNYYVIGQIVKGQFRVHHPGRGVAQNNIARALRSTNNLTNNHKIV